MSNPLQQALFRLDAVERCARMHTPLHRIDPRAKLVVTIVFLVTMLSVPLARLSDLLLFALYPILAAAMARQRYATLLRRSLIVLPLVAFIGLFNIFYDRAPVFRIGSLVITNGWIVFLSILVRGLLSVQALLLLISTTGYYRVCRSMQQLGLPSVFTTQLLFVYRYLHVLIEEALALARARDARSFGRRSYPLHVWGTLVGQLLVRTFERAERIGRAMLARGFTGRIPAGTCDRAAWSVRDTAFLGVWSAALLLLRLCRPAETLPGWLNLFD